MPVALTVAIGVSVGFVSDASAAGVSRWMSPAALAADGKRGGTIKPTFDLADRHKLAPAAPYDPQLSCDVFIEEVTRDAQGCGSLGR